MTRRLSPFVVVPPAWRAANRAEWIAREAAAVQNPERAAAELRRASELLAKAASQMTEQQRKLAMEALEEIRAASVK